MTYQQILRWLADNWNGEFGEKCNVEMRSTGVPFIRLEMDVLEDIVDEEAALRLTRAEVEKRTGRKAIEWREPRKYDTCFCPYGGAPVVIQNTGYCNCVGSQWILGDKLDAHLCTCDKCTEARDERDKLDSPCTGCNSSPCVCTKIQSKSVDERIDDLLRRVEELESRIANHYHYLGDVIDRRTK